jgi:hypothetical protein
MALVARVALTDTNAAELVAAPAVGRIKVHSMTGSNAGNTLSTVDLKDGTTAKFSYAMAANGGGFAMPLRSGWLLTAATALNVVQSAAVASYVTVEYEVVGATG